MHVITKEVNECFVCSVWQVENVRQLPDPEGKLWKIVTTRGPVQTKHPPSVMERTQFLSLRWVWPPHPSIISIVM